MMRFGQIAILCFFVLLQGCFFGKEEEQTNGPTVGVLSTGQAVVGVWTHSFSGTDPQGRPQDAVTQSFEFDPVGGAKITLKTPYTNQQSCTAYGQYRIVGSDILIYVQAVTSDFCNFPYPIQLNDVQIHAASMSYVAAGSADRSYYFVGNQQTLAPEGIWDFDGQGGIDFILFGTTGYFLLQVTVDEEQHLLMGYYIVSGGAVALVIFNDSDPTHVDGEPIVFDSYVTDGKVLQLIQVDDEGNPTIYQGDRF